MKVFFPVKRRNVQVSFSRQHSTFVLPAT